MGERRQRLAFFWTCCLLVINVCTLACSKKTIEDKMPAVEKPLYVVREAANGLLGYVDRTGRYIIKPRFTGAGDFHEGVAAVSLGYRQWYIDEDGDFVSEDRLPISMISRPSQEELVPITRDNKCGYTDKTGEFIIKPQFDRCWSFHEGLAAVKLADKGDPGSRDYIFGKWGFIDKIGEFVIKPQFYSVDDNGFNEGLAAVEAVTIKETDTYTGWIYIKTAWGYIDKTGKFVIKPRFGYASEFREGLAVVQLVQSSPNWGFIDRTGRCIGNRQFSSVRQFREGLAAVALGGEYFPHSDAVYGRIWGFIDKTGEFVISPQYVAVIADFHEGLASVIRDVIQPCLIDKTGKVVAEPHW